MTKTPMWELLEAKDFSDQVFHLNGHSEILKKLKPQNIEQLAAVLAIIRPSKRYLVNKSWEEIMKEVYSKNFLHIKMQVGVNLLNLKIEVIIMNLK